jgi:branched-chain amino acid transport system substrate-binding protein
MRHTAGVLLGLTLASGAMAADKVLRVGAALPLTGALSAEGETQRSGFQIWADTVNAAGGIKAGGDTYKVEMVYTDYQSSTPRAVQAAERLITREKVDFLFGPFGSGAVKAVSAITEKYGVPMIAPNAASEEVYNQGFKYLFGVYTPNHSMTEPVAELIADKHPSIKRLAILARNDLFPLAIAGEMEKSARSRGIEVVYSEKFAIGTVDFSTALAQMRSRKPDWVFIAGYTNDNILVRRQLTEQGVAPRLLTMIVGVVSPSFQESVGPLKENITTFAWWDAAVGYEGKDIFGSSRRFAQLYERQYGHAPEYSAAGAAACGVILQMAIERVGGVDRRKVRDAIASMEENTFWGPIKFGPTGQIVSLKPPLLQIQDGKLVVVHPPEIKQAELRLGGF